MKNYVLLSFLITLSLQTVFGQEANRVYRNYATQLVHHQLIQAHPDMVSRMETMENQIRKNKDKTGDEILSIPVVFHVVYSPGQAIPDISQIKAQLDVLNQDFSRVENQASRYPLEKVGQLTKVAASPNVNFCLAETDPLGNPIESIQFIESPQTMWSIDDLIKQSKAGGADAVFPSNFMNIWLGNMKNGVTGYAQMPEGPANTDGIVMDTKYLFGSTDTLVAKTYGQGKTLTHLVGSYLGLYELWNEFSPCADDKVKDTPIHNAPNIIPGDIYYHISLCDSTYQPEMIMNFMDNTDDEVLNMFTEGQKMRIRAMLSANGARSGLVSKSTSCSQTLSSIENNRINKLSESPTLKLFPNPASQLVNIRLSNPEAGWVECHALNALGEIVWQDKFLMEDTLQTFQIDCSAWREGLYVIMATFGSDQVISQKITIAIP